MKDMLAVPGGSVRGERANLKGLVLGARGADTGSRLYRSQILQANMRLKALSEIYTMHSFAHFFFNVLEFWKNLRNFSEILLNLLNFAKF